MGAMCSRFGGLNFQSYLKTVGDERLRELYYDSELQSELIRGIFNKYDRNFNGVLEVDEFEKICIYIDPTFTPLKAEKLYSALEEVSIQDILVTRSLNIDKFTEFIIPVIKSQIEKESFLRKLQKRGESAGLRQKKIESLTKNVQDAKMDMHLIYRID